MKLEIKNLHKEYRIFTSFQQRLASAMTLGLYAGSVRYHALKGLDLSLGGDERGEIVGIIGPNGAGKSTLLRILAGNARPTSGSVKFAGAVRSILELGVGFSPELTALENIYYNGRLFGYDGRQLARAADEVLEFARLRDFARQPLKTYSTGMQMRLGFALASHQRSDLFLIDEALAVGDASFQQKCIERFRSFREQGSLIVVVSHDTSMLHSVCDRMILLDDGVVRAQGEPAMVVDSYMNLIAEKSFRDAGDARVLEDAEYELRLLDEQGRDRDVIFPGEPCILRLHLRPGAPIPDATVGIHISDSRGIRVFGTNTHLLAPGKSIPEPGPENSLQVDFVLKANLGPGRYAAGCSVHRGRAHANDCFLWEEAVLDFEVEHGSGPDFEGLSFMEPELRIKQAP